MINASIFSEHSNQLIKAESITPNPNLLVNVISLFKLGLFFPKKSESFNFNIKKMNDDQTNQPLLNQSKNFLALTHSDSDNYIDDDSKKTMSIVNLQAMLNVEDVDQVIKLLQENNWDESV